MGRNVGLHSDPSATPYRAGTNESKRQLLSASVLQSSVSLAKMQGLVPINVREKPVAFAQISGRFAWRAAFNIPGGKHRGVWCARALEMNQKGRDSSAAIMFVVHNAAMHLPIAYRFIDQQ